MIRFLGYELYCIYLFENESLVAYSLHYSKEKSLNHMEKIVKYHRLSGKYIIDNRLDKWLEKQLEKYGQKTPEFVLEGVTRYKNYKVYEYLIDLEKTTTYSELAGDLGKSIPEIIMALARNPFLVLIPCHRVLGKDGKISGYTPLGKEFKEKLLKHEKV